MTNAETYQLFLAAVSYALILGTLVVFLFVLPKFN